MTDYRHFDTPFIEFLRVVHKAGRVPCEGRENLFFPEDYPDPKMRKLIAMTAKELCDSCPINRECFEYALESNQRHGVWGGTTPNER
jgi:hypothetical protein